MRLCLKFSLRKPYITGLVTTEVMAIRWQKANIISIILLLDSELSNGSNVSMRMLNMFRGAQDTKKMMVTVMSILLVFLLRSICLDLLWEERGRLLCRLRH